MQVTKIGNHTFQLSMNVENILFEGLWEVPEGVSLNSYVIKGEKVAIIDGVIGWQGVPEKLFAILEDMQITVESIEYLIVNHMEPDHSGWIEILKDKNPNIKIVCSKKAKDLLACFYGQEENIIVVGNDDVLDLGEGHMLTFAEIPNVHWPDTIATLDQSTGILFSCDAFGSFGTVDDKKYAEELSEEELLLYEKETIRYYSNILASFSPQVKKAITKCETLPVKLVAPGHGLMWKTPSKIYEAYHQYADYSKGRAREEITIVWGSMYGMTEKAVNHVVRLLEEENVKTHVHKVPDTSWGTVLTSCWTSSGIILAMPTYEFKMFPPMAAVLEELGKKKVQGRKAFRFGSYGWSGGALRELDDIMSRSSMNWDFIEQVEFLGSPKKEDLDLVEERVKKLIKEVKEREV